MALNAFGVATYTTTVPTASGALTLSAAYQGSPEFSSSTSNSLTENIVAIPVVTWATPAPITYGTPLGATQLNAGSAVSGTFAYSPAAGAVLTAGQQTLTTTFTPTDTTDYATATATVQLTVNEAALTVTANNASMTYGGATPTLSGNLTGVVPGDGITARYISTATSSSMPGTYPITATLNDPNSKLSNYAVTNTPGTLTVGQSTPAITWATPSPITYGSALGAAQLNASTTVAGSFSYSPAAGTLLGPGSQTLKTTFTPSDSTDYTAATASTSLTVNQATPEFLLAASANSTFFANSVTFTATVSAANGSSPSATPPSGTVIFYDGSTQLVTATIATGTAAYTTSNLPAGTHSVTAVYSGDSNYVALTSPGLSEVVENFTVAPPTGGSTSATASPGGQAVYSLVFSPPSGATFPAPINLAVTGLPAGATATFSPSSIPAGAGPTTVTLTVTVPTNAAMQFQRSPHGMSRSPFVLGFILIPFAVIRRRRLQRLGRAAWVLVPLLSGAVLIAGVGGCGGNSGTSTPPPPQSYTLTLTATSGSLSNTTTLTLTVE